ncbi:MAG: IMP cyclohydrolase [Clostridia bacterium]|nr:IMP cyclohydrolase [Clostridia bacterium]
MNVYEAKTIGERIRGNSYVGRGIVIGQSSSCAVSAYFIMGRSENSRNRVFVQKGEDVEINAFDPSKLEDPSLIIYFPVRVLGQNMIVTNGDQTDTIYDCIKQGGTFEQALSTRCFEPDAPNLTPRISGILTFSEETFSYQMSILKSADPQGSACNRYTFHYEPLPGVGHFIHTYQCDGNPIPTFLGEPERIIIPDEIDRFTDDLWENLDADNKVSLYVCYQDLKTGKKETRLINKNQ